MSAIADIDVTTQAQRVAVMVAGEKNRCVPAESRQALGAPLGK